MEAGRVWDIHANPDLPASSILGFPSVSLRWSGASFAKYEANTYHTHFKKIFLVVCFGCFGSKRATPNEFKMPFFGKRMEKQDMTVETKAEWSENGASREPMVRGGTEQEGSRLPWVPESREVGPVIGPWGGCRVDLPRTWRSTGGYLRLQNRSNKLQKQWRNSGGKLLSFAAAVHVFFGVVKTINWCLNPLACKSTGETLAPITVLIQWDWLALVTCCDEKLTEHHVHQLVQMKGVRSGKADYYLYNYEYLFLFSHWIDLICLLCLPLRNQHDTINCHICRFTAFSVE